MTQSRTDRSPTRYTRLGMGIGMGLIFLAGGLRSAAFGQEGLDFLRPLGVEKKDFLVGEPMGGTSSVWSSCFDCLGFLGKSSAQMKIEIDWLAEEHRDTSVGERLVAVSEAGKRSRPHETPRAEVWLVSSREAEWQNALEEALRTIHYWRWHSSDRWEAVGADAFWSGIASPAPTIIYLHGNRSDAATAIQQAWAVCQGVWEAAGERKFRLVIWSWPADRISGRAVRDLRFKAGRSDVEAYLLACHLKQMTSSEPILLVGYSFGARVITGALHLLGGGRIMNHSLSDSDPESGGRFRAILVAAAIGNDWILPGGRHERALSQLERMLVTVNEADPALRWYPALERCDSPALGRTGLRQGKCSWGWGHKVESLPVADSVGKQHDWRAYLHSCELQARLPVYLFAPPETIPSPQDRCSR